MNSVKLGKGGRVVIPASLRRQMGMTVGDELVLHYPEGVLEILTASQAVYAAQELVKRYAGGMRNLAQELITERRREAKSVLHKKAGALSRRARGLLRTCAARRLPG